MPDFHGDRECVTHHACDCIQRKADQCEGLEAMVEELRKDLKEQRRASYKMISRQSEELQELREQLRIAREDTQGEGT